jgi:hypothetical protein
MARGVAQHWIDNPVFLVCWCGKRFQKLADNQLHCSDYHRNMASMIRKYMPKVPPPSPPQRKKDRGQATAAPAASLPPVA